MFLDAVGSALLVLVQGGVLADQHEGVLCEGVVSVDQDDLLDAEQDDRQHGAGNAPASPQATALVFGRMAAEVQGKAVSLSLTTTKST